MLDVLPCLDVTERLTGSWGNKESIKDHFYFLSHAAPVRTVFTTHLVCRCPPVSIYPEDSCHQLLWSSSEHRVPCLPFSWLIYSLLWWNTVSRSFLRNSAWEVKFFRTFMSENVFILRLADILADNAFQAGSNFPAEFGVIPPLSFSFQWCRWEVWNNSDPWSFAYDLFFLCWNL